VVAGVAALGLSAHPQWSATKLRSKLKETAVDVGEDDDHQGAGRVDAANLVGSSEANTVPSAAFTIAPSSPSVDETVRFDASATTDSEGSITAYEWTFGDGATATGRASNHEFASSGTYAVTLTVADDAGGTDTVSKTVTVGAEISTAAPSASFTATPSTAWVREGIAFDATGSTDPDGTIVTYEWDFGDGETATGRTMGHSFDSPGAYTVTLTVVDDAGESDTASKTVHVGRSSAGPAASFTATPSSPWVGEGIAFDARGSDVSNGTIVSYEWAFGDGTTATGTVTGHSFDASGTYTVTLTVADDAGRTDSVSEIVSVAGANAPPSASFTTRPSTASNGRTVSFDATGSTARDGSIERYEWTFGDGTTTTGKRVTHSYDASRDFTVSLTVTDDSGTTETVAKSIAVTPETDDQCASESKTKTTTIEGVSNGHWDSQQYSYRTRLSDTCQVTVILDGPDGSDFDLYVTTDGRTPSSHDFDRRSVGPNSQEAVVLEGVGSKRELGILVDPYAGSGRFSLSIEELGR
jgi:PKD repeat protein